MALRAPLGNGGATVGTSSEDTTRSTADDGWGESVVTASQFATVYDARHELAAALMGRERAGHTLQPTALVNEAYLKLAGTSNVDGSDRGSRPNQPGSGRRIPSRAENQRIRYAPPQCSVRNMS